MRGYLTPQRVFGASDGLAASVTGHICGYLTHESGALTGDEMANSLTPNDPRQPSMLASDAERERTVGALKDHCADGRLTLDEFSQRLDVVLKARTRAELDVVTRDLPVVPLEPKAIEQAKRKLPVRKRVIAVLGDNTFRKRWRVPEKADAIAILGDCRLDLREAVFAGDEIEITAVAVMGDVRITVPEGMSVELSGFALLGDNRANVDDSPPLPGMPNVHVRAYALLGDVRVTRGARAGLPAAD
jgi:hypothetical protein